MNSHVDDEKFSQIPRTFRIAAENNVLSDGPDGKRYANR